MASRTRFDDRPIRERNKSVGQVITFDYAQMNCKFHHKEHSTESRIKLKEKSRLDHYVLRTTIFESFHNLRKFFTLVECRNTITSGAQPPSLLSPATGEM